MSLQQQHQQQQHITGTSALDYSNGTPNGVQLDQGGDASNYMSSYCLPGSSHPPVGNDVFNPDLIFHQGHHSHQGLDDGLKLRMPDTVNCTSATTVTTPDVINMLKTSEYDSLNSQQLASLSDTQSASGDPMKFAMDANAHCSSLGQQQQPQHQQQPPIFPQHQHLGQFHDDPAAGQHHMGLMYPMQHGDSQMLEAIKAEPPMPGGISPGGGSCVSPINLQVQELLKSERKRQRNRIAAHKCRRRKLERISGLEEKVARLKSQNSELNNSIHVLKQQVTELKSKVLTHVNRGCEILDNSSMGM